MIRGGTFKDHGIRHYRHCIAFFCAAATTATMDSSESMLPPDETRAPQVLAGVWVPCALAWITITLRIYVRCWARRNAGWDDLIIGISLVSANMF